MRCDLPASDPMTKEWKGCVIARRGRDTLSLKIKVDGKWLLRSTPFRRGEEDKAERMLAEVRDGLLAREAEGLPSGLLTVRTWSKRWLETRGRDEIADVANDRQRLRDHVLPAIGDMALDEVRPRHLVGLVETMRSAGLAPRTIRNVYGVLRSMWRDAQIADLTANAPCILTHRQLGRVRDANPLWRDEAQLSHGELARLLTDARVTLERRTIWALLGLAMLRHGEMAGLRWRSVQLDGEPLGWLDIVTSYDLGRTKSRRSRRVPIHPSLRPLLAAWRLSGWAGRYGRAPTADDLVLPRPTDVTQPRYHQGTYRLLELDLARLEIRRRHQHGLRRTGISLALSRGAERDKLRWVTHGRPGDVLGLYTTLEWDACCRQVLAIPAVSGARGEVVAMKNKGEDHG